MECKGTRQICSDYRLSAKHSSVSILGAGGSRFHPELARLLGLRRGLPQPGDRRPGLAAAETGSLDERHGDETRPRTQDRRQNRGDTHRQRNAKTVTL